jgi:hypothetical protein
MSMVCKLFCLAASKNNMTKYNWKFGFRSWELLLALIHHIRRPIHRTRHEFRLEDRGITTLSQFHYPHFKSTHPYLLIAQKQPPWRATIGRHLRKRKSLTARSFHCYRQCRAIILDNSGSWTYRYTDYSNYRRTRRDIGQGHCGCRLLG